MRSRAFLPALDLLLSQKNRTEAHRRNAEGKMNVAHAYIHTQCRVIDFPSRSHRGADAHGVHTCISTVCVEGVIPAFLTFHPE